MLAVLLVRRARIYAQSRSLRSEQARRGITELTHRRRLDKMRALRQKVPQAQMLANRAANVHIDALLQKQALEHAKNIKVNMERLKCVVCQEEKHRMNITSTCGKTDPYANKYAAELASNVQPAHPEPNMF